MTTFRLIALSVAGTGISLFLVGQIGTMQGANVDAILAGLEHSRKKLVVYTC